MERKKDDWRKMDNSAKIFPLSGNRKYITVFRISVVLKDMIEPEILQKAVYKALIKYRKFDVRMKKGLFWYYLEKNPAKPTVSKEITYPCRYIEPKYNDDYLFKVTYYRNKINIDIFHSLTDGNGGLIFFNEIVYSYLELIHPELSEGKERGERKTDEDYDVEDSYLKNYNRKSKSNAKSKMAYLLKGKEIRFGAVSATHQIINFEKLKEECKKYDATITQYLTAVLIHSIYEANYLKYKKNDKKSKPIRVCIPVNLKKYFKSKTMSNFFSYIVVNAAFSELDDFDKTVELVKNEFKSKLTEEELAGTMAMTVKFGHNFMISAIPLFAKKIILKFVYRFIQKFMTITYSNVGRVGVIGDYQKYIDYYLFLIAPENVEKIKCSSCSFGDKMTFTFTSILRDNDIEKHFYNFLISKDIGVKVESNGVNEPIIEKKKKDEKDKTKKNKLMIYPKKLTSRSGENAIRIVNIIAVVVSIFLLIINRIVTPHLYWSELSIAGMIYIAVTVSYSIRHGRTIASHFVMHSLMAAAITIYIDYRLGFTGWSLNISVPIIIIIANITMYFVTIFNYKHYGAYALNQLTTLLFSFAANVAIHEIIHSYSVIAIIASIISLVNLFISIVLCFRDLKEEAIKKFNI